MARTDREAIELALLSVMPVQQPKICHIHDTIRLEELMISEALLPQAKHVPHLEVLSELQPLSFDGDGRLQWL